MKTNSFRGVLVKGDNNIDFVHLHKTQFVSQAFQVNQKTCKGLLKKQHSDPMINGCSSW